MDYKKSIGKTILFTLLSLVVATVLLICILYFGFPSTFADFMYNLGSEGIASNLYEKSYEKDGNILYCYKALNIKIKLGQNKNIVELYEDFVSDEEYSEFMKSLTIKNEKLSIGVLEKSTLLNEENYFVNHYIKALIKLGQEEKAFAFALSEFNKIESLSLKQQGVYALGNFINEENANKYTIIYDNFESELIECMQAYFDECQLIFNNNRNAEGNLDRAYVLALGNRIIGVGVDINKVYTFLNINENIKANNMECMIDINDKIKGLI